MLALRFFLLLVLLSHAAFAGGLTAGLMVGLNPNVLGFNTSVTKSEIQLGNYVESDNLVNAGNSTIGSTSSQIVGVPLGLNIRYVESWYLVRFGFLYHITFGGENSISTGLESGQKKEVTESYSARMLELPLTFAFNIRNDDYTRFYAGAGPTLFFGSVRMLFDNGQAGRVVDEDIYSGWALGAHLLIGGEVSLSRTLSLSMEVVFNYGNKAPVSDSAITAQQTSSGTAQDAEDKDSPQLLGVYDVQDDTKFVSYDPEHPNSLEFTGFELVLSFNYFIGIF